MADLKNKRIRLESKIQRLLQHENGVTSHFDYHIHMNSKKNTIELNLLTFNPVQDEYMLLNSVFGKSSIDCIENMEAYLMQEKFDREVEYLLLMQKHYPQHVPEIKDINLEERKIYLGVALW